jgi:hypothetical protein
MLAPPVLRDDLGESGACARAGVAIGAENDQPAVHDAIMTGWPASADRAAGMTIDPAINLPVDPFLRRSTLAVGAIWTPGRGDRSGVAPNASWRLWGRPVNRRGRGHEPEEELPSGGSFPPHEPQSRLTPD